MGVGGREIGWVVAMEEGASKGDGGKDSGGDRGGGAGKGLGGCAATEHEGGGGECTVVVTVVEMAAVAKVMVKVEATETLPVVVQPLRRGWTLKHQKHVVIG